METLEPKRAPEGRSSGVFLALEGPDGGGKTTQASQLVAWLTAKGVDVVACRDPGGTPLGERLRPILLGRDEAAVGLRAEMLLFMASRAQMIDEIIRPALAAGKTVVSDRYLLSNVVYQGYAGGLDVDAIWRVGEAATGGLLPDLTLLLDIAPATAKDRVGPARDRMEDRSDDDRARVRAGFLRAAETYPAPIVVIDGGSDRETVAARLRNEVARVLALGPRS